MVGKLAAIGLSATVYTLVRYTLFGGVSPIHIPLYLLNKSISLSSVFFLFFTALNHTKNETEKTEFWGTAVLHGTYLHVMLSLALLSKAYYPKFFGLEKMNLTGEITILFGILTVYFFWFVRSKRYVFNQRHIFQSVSGLFLIGHLTTMGYTGWLEVGSWHGGLPPISLIGFILATISFILFLKTRQPAS
jgi:hypothetical protein